MGAYAVVNATVASAGADSVSLICAFIFAAFVLIVVRTGHLRDAWPRKFQDETAVIITLSSGIKVRVPS